MIQLNKNINVVNLHREYSKNKRIMVDSVLEFDGFSKITEKLKHNIPYLNAYSLNGQYIQSSDDELKNMSPNKMRALQQTIYENASKGVGFFYGRYEITQNEKDELLKELFNYLNGQEVLKLISDVTGVKGLKSASVQLTRYVPGNFLTRHNDVLPTKQRAIAFVFGFTPQWHPDWGGLLHFYEMDGKLTETFMPKSNVLSLFDVQLPHSVSYVTPFARAARYSITGWFNLK